MNSYFNNMMFNPQYVNPNYYNMMPHMSYEQQQDKRVYDAVKAIHDLCESVKGMDEQHQRIAFSLCLEEMASEFGW